MPEFSKASLERLKSCHPDIRRVMEEVIKHTDILIVEGSRDQKKQAEAVLKGTSMVRWPRSYHNTQIQHIRPEYRPKGLAGLVYCSLAIDIAPYPLDWKDIKRFTELGPIVKSESVRLGIPLDWAPDLKWKDKKGRYFPDYPHYQLTDYRITE